MYVHDFLCFEYWQLSQREVVQADEPDPEGCCCVGFHNVISCYVKKRCVQADKVIVVMSPSPLEKLTWVSTVVHGVQPPFSITVLDNVFSVPLT
ncbi:hypothetical protein Q9233_007366 [Columba guinea]|nr:hypothetical protein Q9233_007366 [Columba guinea]